MNEIPAGTPLAAPWSLFAGELGKGSVMAAIAFFVAAFLVSLMRRDRLDRAGTLAFALGCISLLVAFGALTTLFVKDQFQYQYVWSHSDSKTSLAYKIASVWTAQEGSFLLWACSAAVFGLLTVRGTGLYRRAYVGTYSLFLGTLGGILAYETPFKIIPQLIAHGKTFVPPEGNGMVPSLQNYWVIIHPPVVFLGFGSLTVFAAYAVAAMLQGDVQDWVSRVRPWTLLTTAVLGLGIVMGGLWAYETQGWGGFWAWDPVENVSFVPWLFTVVLAHGIIVQTARKKWVGANLWLAGLPFLTFVYGTFLTRSGLLDKVSNHSFASMDGNARFILKIFLFAAIGLFAAVWFARGRAVAAQAVSDAPQDERGIHREGMYRYGMTLLGLMATVIALGMSWPVVTALRGGEGSAIKEPVYHLVVTWFFLPLMALIAVTPFVSWRAVDGKSLGERLFGVLCVSVGVTGLLHLVMLSTPFGVHLEPGATVAAPFGRHVPLALWMLVLLFSVVFVVVANLWRVVEMVRRSAMGTGGFVAHLGLSVLLGGLILSRGYERTSQLTIRPGASDSALGYTVAYKGATTKDFFDRNRKLEFDVTMPSGEHVTMLPGQYKHGDPNDPKVQTWPAIERFSTHDVYLATSAPQIMATEEPVAMTPGQTRDLGESTMLEYLAPTNNGKFGQMGAQFGAKLRLTVTDARTQERRQYMAAPSLEITPEGLMPSLPRFGPDFRVALVGGMDAKTQGVKVALLYSPEIYYVQLYEKPYTGLIWLGTGIMTFGGLLSAYARRRVVARQRRTAPAPRNDAPVPAPQS